MDTKTEVTGGLVLGFIVLVLVLWYMSENPAPITRPVSPTTSKQAGSQGSPTLHLTESGKYYTLDAAYPGSTPLQASAGATADAKAVTLMKAFAQNSLDTFKEGNGLMKLTPEDIRVQGLDQGRSYSLAVTYSTRTGKQSVSYVYTLFMDTLGAHPNTYFRTFTFNSGTGDGMDISDLFLPGMDYLTLLSKETRRVLPDMLAHAENVSVSEINAKFIHDGTTPDPDNFQNWYIDGSTLVIIFPPYQVAPYVDGPQEVRLPLSTLPGVRASYK